MSTTRTIATGPAPIVRIERAAADLIVQGTSVAEIRAETDSAEELQIEHREQVVTLRCRDDLILHVPADATLHLQTVQGDARLGGVTGPVHVGQIDGDLQVREAGDTRIEQVQGDLVVRQVRGELTVGAVQGDALVGGIRGHVLITSVGGDLMLEEIGGSIEATAGGDMSVRLAPGPEQSYLLNAGGDIICRLPDDSGVTASLRGGGSIRVRKLPVVVEERSGVAEFVLGDGKAKIALSAGGDILVAGRRAEWGEVDFGMEFGQQAADFAEQLGRQIEVQIEAATRQLDARLSSLDSEDIGAKVQEKVQAALRKAEEKLSQAARNLEKQPRPSWQAPPRPSKPEKPAKPPVSSEERLMILRMVDEGKLSVDQAEQLLAALGARKKS